MCFHLTFLHYSLNRTQIHTHHFTPPQSKLYVNVNWNNYNNYFNYTVYVHMSPNRNLKLEFEFVVISTWKLRIFLYKCISYIHYTYIIAPLSESVPEENGKPYTRIHNTFQRVKSFIVCWTCRRHSHGNIVNCDDCEWLEC